MRTIRACVPQAGAALVIAAVLLASSPSEAQSPSVTLTWDPVPGPQVAGYVVFARRMSDGIQERLDVRHGTSATYYGIVPGVGYEFSVAAVDSSGLVGQRTSPVFYLSGMRQSIARVARSGAERAVALPSPPSSPPSAAGPASGSSGTPHPTPFGTGATLLANTSGVTTALESLDRGRVIFVEDRRRIVVLETRTASTAVALSQAVEGEEFVGLAVSPRFEADGYVYVGIAGAGEGRNPHFRIVRYRLLRETLSEPATLTPSLPITGRHTPPFTVDAAGQLYVLLGAESATGRHGQVLRFERDATASVETSRVTRLADGLAVPSAVVWQDTDNTLWLAGTDDRGIPSVGRLPLSAPNSPRTTTVLSGALSQETRIAVRRRVAELDALVIDPERSAIWRLVEHNGKVVLAPIPLPPGLRVALATLSEEGDVVVAVRAVGHDSGSVILRLDPSW